MTWEYIKINSLPERFRILSAFLEDPDESDKLPPGLLPLPLSFKFGPDINPNI